VEFARLSIESEIALKKARKAPLNAIVKECSEFAIV
jgi:hypothetical protein